MAGEPIGLCSAIDKAQHARTILTEVDMKSISYVLLVMTLLSNHAIAYQMHLVEPNVRSYACMVNDAVNDRVLLFGGGNYRQFEGALFNDVWAFDPENETWSLIAVSGQPPEGRVWASAVCDSCAVRMIVFGGSDAGAVQYNDLYGLDLTGGGGSWQELMTTGSQPPPTASASAIIDEANYRLLVFGGESSMGLTNSVWSLDLTTLCWSQISPQGTPPAARFAHSAVYDGVSQRMIVFGGQSTTVYNDVWSLSLVLGSETWQELTPTGVQPGGRTRHFCSYDNLNNDMVIGFGFAYPGYYVLYNDIWKLDLSTLAWQEIFWTGCPVQGRRGAASAFNPGSQKIVIFGGDQPYASYYGETHVLDMNPVAVMETDPSVIPVRPSIAVLQTPTLFPLEINVFVPFTAECTCRIFDICGRAVRTLMDHVRVSGNLRFYWNGDDERGTGLPSGTYFVRIEADGQAAAEKVVVVD